jgi:hypothetical protein
MILGMLVSVSDNFASVARRGWQRVLEENGTIELSAHVASPVRPDH